MRERGEGALERGAGWLVAPLSDVLQKREIDDLAVDETAVIIAKVPAIDKQVAGTTVFLERFIGCNDEKVDIRVVPGIPLGNRATDD
jgi:hypothetical protein